MSLFHIRLLTFCCTIFIGIQLSAQSLLEQNVTINVSEMPLQDAVRTISQQTGVPFTFSNHIFQDSPTVQLHSEGISLKTALNKLLVGTDIYYREIGQTIVLYPKEAPRRKKILLSGYIESIDGKPIELAYIYNNKNQKGTQSDMDGLYEFWILPDSIELVIDALGFDKEVRNFVPTQSTKINFTLHPTTQLSEIIVLDSTKLNGTTPLSLNGNDFEMNTVMKKLPIISSGPNLERGLMLLPGVQSSNEGVSGLFVRGGSVDQNKLMIDGISIYNPAHLLGVFSVFNMDIVKSATFIKEGFPAKYGNRLSSFLDLETSSGNRNKFTGQGSLGLLSSRLSLSGPLNAGNTSFLFSGRQSHTNLLLAPYNKYSNNSTGADRTINYHFYDVFAKVHHLFKKEKDELFITFFNTNDKFTYNKNSSKEEAEKREININKNDLTWGNLLFSMQWKHQISQVLSLHTSLSHTKYRFNAAELFEYRTLQNDDWTGSLVYRNYASRIDNFGIKMDGHYQVDSTYQLSFGVETVQHGFTPGSNAIQLINPPLNLEIDTVFNRETIKATEFNLYIDNKFKIGTNIELSVGLRESIFSSNGKNFTSLQPRLSGKWRFRPSFDAHGSFSIITQQVHLITNSGVGLPTDTWIPSTGDLKPEQSQLLTGGLTFKHKGFFEINVDLYLKRQNNLVSFEDGSSFLLDGNDWEEKLSSGKGSSYGGELFVRFSNKKLLTWAGYTLSRTERQFNTVNEGKAFPFKYDRTHDFSWAMVYQIGKNIKLSATWVYGTGSAFTPPSGKIHVDDGSGTPSNTFVYIYGERNSRRMSDFHRLNLGAEFYKKKKRIERTVRISVYNVYNQRNPFFITIGQETGEERDEFRSVSIFPILPSLSYDFKF